MGFLFNFRYPRVLTFVFIALFSFSASSHEGAVGVVKERMDRFKQSKSDLGEIRIALRKGEPETAQALALKLAEWGGEMATHFPEGSNPRPSEALDRIWQDWPTFEQQIERYTTSAQTMADLIAEGAPKSSLDKAFKDLGRTCKVCHNRFKAN